MTKLNQIVAVVTGLKPRLQRALTEVHHKIQADDLLKGITKTYRPKDEDGDALPSEEQRVRYRVGEARSRVRAVLSELFDAVLTQDYANTDARATVAVPGVVILVDVPVTYLMFLEHQLTDIHTFVSKLPTLDPASEWVFDETANCFATAPQETVRTKKVPRSHVLYEATKDHPAQVQAYNEDVVVGYWSRRDFSGAIPEREKADMLHRIHTLQDAVKSAREEANGMEVTQQTAGDQIFDYLFGE